MEKRKFIFVGCLFFSIFIHFATLYFIYKHPFSIRLTELGLSYIKPAPSPEVINTPEQDPQNQDAIIGKINQALEESFNKIIATAKLTKDIEITDQKDLATLLKPELVDIEETTTTILTSPFNPILSPSFQDFAQESSQKKEYLSFPIEKRETVNPIEPFFNVPSPVGKDPQVELEMDFFYSPTLQPEKATYQLIPFKNSIHSLEETAKTAGFPKKNMNLPIPPYSPSPPVYATVSPVDYLREEWMKRHVEIELPKIDHYQLEPLIQNLEYEESLHAEVSFIPDNDEEQYIFSLTIYPDMEIETEKMKQNFYFFIDRSNSIEKRRFNGFKRAVQRALFSLNEGAAFNICIFDKNIARLSEKNLMVSPKNLQFAEEFLDRQEYKAFFSAGDLFHSLEKIIPENFSPGEMHYVILISDGNTLLSAPRQKRAIAKWVERNQGKAIVYTAAAGQGNNLPLLDVLSYSTGGKLLYSDTYAAFPRKLVKMIRDLNDVLIKDITVEAHSSTSGHYVQLYPKKAPLNPLFSNRPYTLIGTTNKLTDFSLYLQGRSGGKWLTLKKTISFKEAQKGGRSLEKLWATVKANSLYENFLKDGKSTNLKEAKKVLAPYKGTICAE
ncbi:MAG: hypothetical protein L0207_04180 [Chlamydiae bacterium]|nr:hypothetical protein [Chlamydiota bacterium]